MHFRAIMRTVGVLVLLFSVVMLLPGIVSLVYRDGAGLTFVKAFLVTLLIGLVLWLPNKEQRQQLKKREGFLIVVLFWTVLGSIGALPFLLNTTLHLSITDAFFESFSGLTTTGATTIVGLDKLPKAILFYRQMLQWFGGMGIIVLAVAIIPVLGIGGMQLYRAEIPGPMKEDKMRPRVAETAKILWYLYLFLTILCAIALWLAGMTPFDAICHSFSTISIGGFSTHDASIGFYHSPLINTIIAVFLLIAGCNFGLHYSALTKGQLKFYWRDTEFKVFIAINLILTLVVTIILSMHHFYGSFWSTLDQAFFQVVSIATTAGFTTTNFSHWPTFLPIILMIATFIGGCAGSTGGGMKVIRIILLYLQGIRELKRLVHPNAIYPIKLGRRGLPDSVIQAIWGFFSAYTLVFVIAMLAMIATGMTEFSAFSAAAAALNNVGPGLGTVAENYVSMNLTAKWIFIITMLFGRLEIFSLLVLFIPTFWKD